MENKENLNSEIRNIINLINEYSKNYFNGDFENCNKIFLSIIRLLINIIEKVEFDKCFNENLSKTLEVFEKKDWVLLNDILVYDIRNELITSL